MYLFLGYIKEVLIQQKYFSSKLNLLKKMELNFTLWRIYCILIILKTYLLDTIYNTTYNEIMAQWEKLLAKILSLDKDMRFTELQRVLQSYGYTVAHPKRGSSHYTFRKTGCNPITIPKHEPIKVFYVKMVKEIVEAEEANKKKED